MPTIHKKILKKYFEEIVSGKKKFELRIADFSVSEGDVLVLEEWDRNKKEYTGRKIEVVATYILKTKDLDFFFPDNVQKHGFQVIQFEIKEQNKEPEFKPQKGQVDYTHIRYAPVINCVLRNNNKILIVQRSSHMRLYPGFWNGISGFLDDQRSIEEKVYDELREELGIHSSDITTIYRGSVFDQEESAYNKTWIVHPVLVDVKTDKIKLDWEAQNYKWIQVEEIRKFDLLPGFDQVLKVLLNKNSS